jgi:carbonic anhydrase
MKELIEGIVEFRRTGQEKYRKSFGHLAESQSPNTLFIACSDSRVVPNTFASTKPGELFVLRNVGNLIPQCGDHGVSSSDESEAAVIEFSTLGLKVADIIVCGHSNCGAMGLLLSDRAAVETPNLRNWLRHGDRAVERLKSGLVLNPDLPENNQLSQINVLLQMEHVKTYPSVAKRVKEGNLRVHGWWFDVGKADVYSYSEEQKTFNLIDENYASTIEG